MSDSLQPHGIGSPWNSLGQNTGVGWEWVAIAFSKGSSQPKDRTQVSHIAGGFFTIWAPREAHVATISIILEKISKISLLELQHPQKLKYEVG